MAEDRQDSFINDCEALDDLLQDEEPPKPEICRHVDSMCDYLWSNGLIDWQTSLGYKSMMLFADADAHLHRLDHDIPPSVSNKEIRIDRSQVLLAQIVARVLSAQSKDGSWLSVDGGVSTVYALVIVDATASLPRHSLMLQDLQIAIERGRKALITELTKCTYPSGTRKPCQGL